MQTRKYNKNNYEAGQVMLTMVIFFMFASLVVAFGVVNPILKQVAVSKNLVISKESYFLANSSLEDVFYRLKNNRTVGTTETLSLNNATTTTITTNTATGRKITSTADKNTNIRKMETNVVLGSGASFNYGVQTGPGGFILENSATLTGNIYSSGSVVGSGNTIYGDAVSAGPSGLIDGIHTTGSAYAHTITNSDVDINAYYVTKTSTTVDGISYPGSADQPTAPMPIDDEQIEAMEADALAGGVVTCSAGKYTITTTRTLGPIKIPCDLEISGTPTVTLGGAVWVTGNVEIKNSAVIRVSSSLGSQSVAIIADNPSNRTTSSKIDLANTSTFYGSGTTGSFVFLISQNESAELGGSEDAIQMDNSASGAVILYASHGLININNSATLKEVTGYKIKAKNTANIIYDTGLVNTLFTGGPGGGYEIIDWREVE